MLIENTLKFAEWEHFQVSRRSRNELARELNLPRGGRCLGYQPGGGNRASAPKARTAFDLIEVSAQPKTEVSELSHRPLGQRSRCVQIALHSEDPFFCHFVSNTRISALCSPWRRTETNSLLHSGTKKPVHAPDPVG